MNGINADALKEHADDPNLIELPLLVNYHFFNPKAGLTYSRGGHLLYASFAVANRDPSRDNYTENILYDKSTGSYSGTMPRVARSKRPMVFIKRRSTTTSMAPC